MARTYATWNPADKATPMTLSNGDLTVAWNYSGYYCSLRANQGKSSGKWYWEVTPTTISTEALIGVANSSARLDYYTGQDANGWSYYKVNGNKYNNAISTAYGTSYAAGNIIGIALDMDAGKVWFSKNGTWQNSGDPAAGTNAAFTGLTGTLYPTTSGAIVGNHTANFGASAFTYSAPSGFNSGVYTGEDTSIPVIMNQYRQRRN